MEIKLEALNVAIGDKLIVRNINIDLRRREFIGLIGPNGSGKSTILRALYRALKPSGGKIYFDGKDLAGLGIKYTARKLGVMKQNSSLAFDFKVMDLVLMGRTAFKKPLELDSREDFAIARDALAKVGLDGYENRYYNQLSGGEQQRVMIARVLTGQPETLLLDEMTNHLDLYYQLHLLKLVKDMHTEVLAVMHDLNLAARFCSRLYLLDEGRIVAFGKTEEILSSPILQEVFNIKTRLYKDDTGRLHVLYQDILA